MHAPAFSQHTKFLDRVEDLTVEELIPELGVEAFAVAVLPWYDEIYRQAEVGKAANDKAKEERLERLKQAAQARGHKALDPDVYSTYSYED